MLVLCASYCGRRCTLLYFNLKSVRIIFIFLHCLLPTIFQFVLLRGYVIRHFQSTRFKAKRKWQNRNGFGKKHTFPLKKKNGNELLSFIAIKTSYIYVKSFFYSPVTACQLKKKIIHTGERRKPVKQNLCSVTYWI